MRRLDPGASIGIIGSGQLGRMTCMAAKRMGYAVHIYSPDVGSPAGQVTDQVTVAAYEDLEALKKFAGSVDVITLEFENIPLESFELLAGEKPVFPRPAHLALTQDRLKEKTALHERGLPVTPFLPVQNASDLKAALEHFKSDVILKTCRFGYDGKGQRVVQQSADVTAEFSALGSDHLIAERKIELAGELSVLVSRNEAGETSVLGPFENEHAGGILDVSTYPSRFSSEICEQALSLGRRFVAEIDYQGILCVELFLSKDGQLLINELAPRPHNSGHLTIEAFHTSQFEMHVRAVCNLPPGSSEAKCSAAMVNLLGDLWDKGSLSMSSLQECPHATLHLYGKKEPLPGRKMGHITTCAGDVEVAKERARKARTVLFGK